MQRAGQKQHKHYDFIDGLRAVAISLVLLFHFELLHFPGGFLGVDVFFVISGFLVSGILFRDLERGQFSLSKFYRRRVLRILPALYFTLLCTLAIAYFFLLPEDAITTAKSAEASALIISNHYFYNNINYFNSAYGNWFLLHNWSLSVEEQFYLIFPLAAAFLFRSKLSLAISIAVLTLLSAAYSLYLSQTNSSAAFYIASARCWEFLVGVQIAVLARKQILPKWQASILVSAGMAMIAIPALILQSQASFHVIPAMFPVFGTALIIWASLRSDDKNTGGILTIPAFRFLGKISYSVYLVHWPILLLAQYISIEPLSDAARAALMLFSLLFGWVSWAVIETPFRTSAILQNMSGLRLAAAVLIAIILIVGLANWVVDQKSSKDAITPQVAKALAAGKDYSPDRAKCHADEVTRPIDPQNACRLGSGKETVAMWSDSHGVELARAVANDLQISDISLVQLTSSACPPLIDWESASMRPCPDRNRKVLDYLRQQPDIHTVILTMRYDGYPDVAIKETLESLEKSVVSLDQAKKNIIIVGPFPKPEFDVPKGIARAMYLSWRQLPDGLPREYHIRDTELIRRQLSRISKAYGLIVVDPANILCGKEKCPYVRDQEAIYFDDNHPSMHGVEPVARKIADAIVKARD